MDKITELAMMLKERDNLVAFDISTAVVISVYPVVLKLSEKVFLSKEYNNLKISASLLTGFKQKLIGSGILANTNSVNDGGQGALNHEHRLTTFSATLELTEHDFKLGDELIVIPIANGEMWYAIDRVGVF